MTPGLASGPTFDTAVLFLVFNRPEPTKEVFEAIRQAKPPRLYVAGDGPRVGRTEEAALVAEVRKIATQVDWPCEVRTLFRDENFGCKYAVSDSISWFFDHEEQGIILEDDCLPHPDFFNYCQWALQTFRDDKQIWHINGNNFSASKQLYKDNVDFTALPQVWGWATWSDRWKNYDVNPFYVGESVQTSPMNSWAISGIAKRNKYLHLEALKQGLDTWDYQWQLVVLMNSGIVVSAKSNLISNLGDGDDATHTRFDSRARLPMDDFAVPEMKPAIRLNKKLTYWYESKMGLHSRRAALKQVKLGIEGRIRKAARTLLKTVFFGNRAHIVVASTGRSGSTMLTDAIAASLVKSRLGTMPHWARNLALRVSRQYCSRLDQITPGSAPVLKTHDIYRHERRNLAKYIFVYGDPLVSALSARKVGQQKGSIWLEAHIYHLGGVGIPNDVLQDDVLNYRGQIESWGNAEDVFVVHYDEIWEKSAELGRFLGFPVALPERRQRPDRGLPVSFNQELFDGLEDLSKSLRERTLAKLSALEPEGISGNDRGI